MNLTMSAHAREISNGSVATTRATFQVQVDAVADTPVVSARDIAGLEDQPIALNLSAALPEYQRAGPAGSRGRAVVLLADRRLFSFVTKELTILGFEVRGLDNAPVTNRVDLAVSDDHAALEAAGVRARRTVLFAEANGTRPPGAAFIGRRPRLDSIQNELRTVADQVRREGGTPT